MTHKKITKKNMEKFFKHVKELLTEFNAKDGGHLLYKWTIESPVGDLYITLHDSDLKGSTLYSIYTLFEDPQAASKYFDCNSYSGKCNIHTFDMDQALRQFHVMLLKLKRIESDITVGV
jgi:hypothetical protein